MKAIKYLFLFSFIYTSFSCIDDLGNYEYVTKENILPISISGFNDTTMLIGNELNIVPKIDNMDDESRYVYSWYATKASLIGVVTKRDTLSIERNLSVQIKLESGQYNLFFEIRNTELDIYVCKKITLEVQASNISTGWYVLKDIDNKTDFDYISLDGSITVHDVLKNQAAYQQYQDGPAIVGDLQLKGKALKIVRQNGMYYHQVENSDGTVTLLNNQIASLVSH